VERERERERERVGFGIAAGPKVGMEWNGMSWDHNWSGEGERGERGKYPIRKFGEVLLLRKENETAPFSLHLLLLHLLLPFKHFGFGVSVMSIYQLSMYVDISTSSSLVSRNLTPGKGADEDGILHSYSAFSPNVNESH
jgi:hypothetical protein